MTALLELQLLIILPAIFFLPGSAILLLSGEWKRWSGLQRCFLSAGLSIAFYPALFYLARFLLPGATLSAGVMRFLLLSFLLVTLRSWWLNRPTAVRFERLEWVAIIILALTLFSRFWFAHAHPYPAWSDSLHHTLLTRLTAQSGRLPQSLEPYFPNTLGMYHLGLYAIAGTVEMVAQVPAHSAILWTSQVLNGLCGIGIYLFLDRFVGRTGAIAGLAVAGLYSPHPALWSNWGRFTQPSSQMLLPFAWMLTLEVISFPAPSVETARPKDRIWTASFAVLCTAAVFMLHFRVAGFYLLLLVPTGILSLWRSQSTSQRRGMLKTLLIVGALSLLIVGPILWHAGGTYLAKRLAPVVQSTETQQAQIRQNYYFFPLSSFPYLAAPRWLLALGGVGTLFGLFRRNLIAVVTVIWVAALSILGNLYLLDIPVLNVTNLGAILIMAYLPISLLIGIALEEALGMIPLAYRPRFRLGVITVVMLTSLPATRARSTYLEPERHFIHPQDVSAMEWISANTPADATFAINTYFWLPGFAHGTDAGYWIPYFTNRHIVTSSMITDGAPAEYRQRVLARSRLAEALESDLGALGQLYETGVEYIYVGSTGDFSGPGLQPSFLTASDRVSILYENEGAYVLQIGPGIH